MPLSAQAGAATAFSLLVRSRQPIPAFPQNRGGRTGAEEPGWKKSRTSPRSPVQSSQNALEAARRAALNRTKTDCKIELPR